MQSSQTCFSCLLAPSSQLVLNAALALARGTWWPPWWWWVVARHPPVVRRSVCRTAGNICIVCRTILRSGTCRRLLAIVVKEGGSGGDS
jgi:hypothetical protein